MHALKRWRMHRHAPRWLFQPQAPQQRHRKSPLHITHFELSCELHAASSDGCKPARSDRQQRPPVFAEVRMNFSQLGIFHIRANDSARLLVGFRAFLLRRFTLLN